MAARLDPARRVRVEVGPQLGLGGLHDQGAARLVAHELRLELGLAPAADQLVLRRPRQAQPFRFARACFERQQLPTGGRGSLRLKLARGRRVLGEHGDLRRARVGLGPCSQGRQRTGGDGLPNPARSTPYAGTRRGCPASPRASARWPRTPGGNGRSRRRAAGRPARSARRPSSARRPPPAERRGVRAREYPSIRPAGAWRTPTRRAPSGRSRLRRAVLLDVAHRRQDGLLLGFSGPVGIGLEDVLQLPALRLPQGGQTRPIGGRDLCFGRRAPW